MQRAIVHVDMDAFFASVEQRDDPKLRQRPVLVGRLHRGVVCAASYEARAFGARSAMPMAEAVRRCPQAVVVTPRFAAYREASAAIFAIFHRYTPQVEGLSLDEAFLDVTHSEQLFGSAAKIASAIRAAIAHEIGLTASAGVAPCKFVAKIASDWRKPNGQWEVTQANLAAFLAPLPVAKIPGVGPKCTRKLEGLGLATLGKLQVAGAAALQQLLGKEGASLHRFACGVDLRPVVAGAAAKSIGAEATLVDDATCRATLEKHLLGHALTVAGRLHHAGLLASGVQVKLKDHRFDVQVRQLRLTAPSRDPDALHEAARTLLDRFTLAGRKFRLTGLAVHDLVAAKKAPAELFTAVHAHKRAAIEDVRAQVCGRFGAHKLTRATLLAMPQSFEQP